MSLFKKKEKIKRVIFWMKSGARIHVKCQSCIVNYTGGTLTSYKIEGVQDGQVLFLCISDISAITSEDTDK